MCLMTGDKAVRFDLARSRSAMALLFVVAIFMGDVWLGITVPISMLLAPVLFVTMPVSVRDLIPALLMLAGLAAVVGLRWASGFSPNGKSDLVVYLPFAYAGLTILALRNVRVEDRSLGRVIVAGGAITGAFMLIVAAVAPPGTAFVPGQNFWATDQQYAESRKTETLSREQATLSEDKTPQLFGAEATKGEYKFYDVKNRFKTPLGLSNYLAVFFVFAFIVSAFTDRNWWAALFAAFTLVTLSRFGIGFLILSGVCVGLYRLRISPLRIAVFTVAVSAAMIATLWFARDVPFLPTSLTARIDLWKTGVEAIALNPLIGSFRSQVIETLNLSLTWNPHNLILLVWTYFGAIGLVLYLGYLSIILRAFYCLSVDSKLWAGVFVGSVVLLCWGGFEPVAMTAAFEILMATLYVLAVSRRKQQRASVPH